MEHARRSSARTSASRGLPTSVRSPQRTSTSALVEISANSSRPSGERSSRPCRSRMAAKVTVWGSAAISSLAPLVRLGEAPVLDRRLVIDVREHSPAAYFDARGRQLELPLEAAHQLVHEPARHVFALTRIGPTEVEQMHQEHLPVQIHVGEEAPPIDAIVLLEDEVNDVGAVVAMPQLDKGLGPDQLGRRDHAHRYAEHLDARGVLEPFIAHRQAAAPGGKDHVEEVLAAEDLGEPTLVLDLDGIAEALEAFDDARVIARLAEDVEVLGRPRDAGVDAERIGATEQERQSELGELAQGVFVEGAGQRRRRGWLACGVDGANIAGCPGIACHEIIGQNVRRRPLSMSRRLPDNVLMRIKVPLTRLHGHGAHFDARGLAPAEPEEGCCDLARATAARE